jgi:drug/metabolite transporter (DMT)-like permease
MCTSARLPKHGSDEHLSEAGGSSSAARQSNPRPRLGAAAAIAAAVVMAGYVVLSKQFVGPSDGSSNVGAFLLARQLIASAVMLALAACRHGCLLPRPEHRGVIGRLGFLNFVNAIGFVWGVKLTTAFVTSVLQLSIPVLTLLYSTLAGLEQPSAAKGGALLLTLLGCALVAVGGAGEQAAAAAAGGDGPDDPSPRGALSLVVGVAILVAQCTSFVGLVVTRGPPVRRRRAPCRAARPGGPAGPRALLRWTDRLALPPGPAPRPRVARWHAGRSGCWTSTP